MGMGLFQRSIYIPSTILMSPLYSVRELLQTFGAVRRAGAVSHPDPRETGGQVQNRIADFRQESGGFLSTKIRRILRIMKKFQVALFVKFTIPVLFKLNNLTLNYM